MALTYDIENDIRFKQGIEKGALTKATIAVKNLLQLGLSKQQIAKSLEVSLEFVEDVVRKIKK